MKLSFVNKKSAIHNLNPSLKFIAFVVIIVMIFLPLGFFAQFLIGTLLIVIYIFSKLSFKKFWNIIKSIIFLFIILLLVNWMIYKTPIAVHLYNYNFPITIGPFSWLSGQSGLVAQNNDGWSFVSDLYGGNIIGFFEKTNNTLQLNINGVPVTIDQILNNVVIDKDKILAPYYDIINGQKVPSDILKHILQWIGNDENLAAKYIYLLNSGEFVYNGQKFIIEPLANSAGGLWNINSAVVYQTFWYTFSPRAIQLAIYISIKVFLMILASTLLTTTTTSIELSSALEDILSPLKIIRFPVVEASMMIAIALRFVPSLLDESQRIFNAQSSRGVDFKNGNVKDKFKAMISLIVPLFNIAFLKSGELANAMEARSYSTRYARSRYRTFKLHFVDWLAFAILCLLMGFLIGILIKPLMFTPFGLFELGMLIN